MFAGRYAWWMLTGGMLILFSLVAFDALAGVTVGIAGCRASESACHALSEFLKTSLKPLLVALSGLIMTGAVVLRLAWLRFRPLWMLAALFWALALAATLRSYMPLWHENPDLWLLLHVLPPSAHALVALSVFLLFPLEDEDRERQQPAPIGLMAGFAALGISLQLAATADGLPMLVRQFFHMPAAARLIAEVQTMAAAFLQVDHGNLLPGIAMVALFALSLALRITRHERPAIPV